MAKKEYNVDLDIKGKVSATTVPNSTGSIVTWNSSTKVFGLRTNAEIIADLNLSSNFVPYTGATANVNLGARSITSTGGFIGNASTATKLSNITTTFTGTYPVTVNVNGTIYSHTGLTYTGSTGALSANTFIGELSGNATTATTLATARTINGTSFNGSTNITTANWGAARNITIGNTTKSVDGSANVSWSLAEIGINTGDFVPYTGANKAVDLNTQKLTIGGDFEKRNVSFEKSYLNNSVSNSTHFTRLTDVASFSRGSDSTTTSDCIVITLPIRSSTRWVMEVDIFSPSTSSIFSGAPTKLLISAYSISNLVRSVTAISSADNVKSVSFCRDIDNNTIIIIRSNSSSNFNYGKVNITNFYHGVSYSSDLAVKTNYKVDAVVESSLTDLTTNGTITNEQFTRDSYLWNKGNFSQADLDNWNVAFNRGDFRDFGLGNVMTNSNNPNSWNWDNINVNSIHRGSDHGITGITDNLYGLSLLNSTTSKYGVSIAGHSSGRLFIQGYHNGTAAPWREVWHTGNFNPSDYATVTQLSGYVPTSRTITAGNGLSGGGSLAANRTITLGTPSSIGLTSTNSVTSTSHTHALDATTTTAINNGQTAFGWGNHALVGYLTTTALNNYYQSGDVNIPAKGGDYVVFPETGSGQLANFDFDTITATGFYNKLFNAGAASTYNAPKTGYYGHVEVSNHGGNILQITRPYRVSDGMWMRNRFGGNWTPWVEFIHSGNLSSYANSLLTDFVPTSRTITINGVTQNLSANRTWTVPDTITRLRGTTSGTYTSGDLTLLAGANTTITQSGSNITIASTNTNTTYSAGTGLSLTGTTFGQTITTSGTGTFVTGITQTTNGFQVNLGTPPNTVYSTDTLAILNAGTSTSGALQTAKNLNDWLNGKGFSTQTLSAGSGVSIVGSVISNSAPNIDQKLSISGMKITLDRSGGTVTVPSSNLVTSSTATGTTNVATTNTNTYLNIVEGGTTLGSSTQVTGAGAVSVSSDAAGKLTITGVDTTYNTFTKTNPGLVPAPTGTTSTRFLREDGSWVTPTDSTYSAGTLALLQEGTNTTNRVWSPKILTDFTDGKYLQLSGGTITGDLGIGIAPTAKLDVNGTVRFRNFSNTLLSTDSNGNLSNTTNLILESNVLRPSTASGISLGNSVTPFANLYLIGSGYFTGNMMFGNNDQVTAMRTTIGYDGDIKANNHIKFLSDGNALLDKRNQGFMSLDVNRLDIGHDDYEHTKIFNQYGSIGIYDDTMEINHHVVSINALNNSNVSVSNGRLRLSQNRGNQLSAGVVELDSNNLYTTSSAGLGTSSNRWGKLWGTNVDFNGNMVVGKINNARYLYYGIVNQTVANNIVNNLIGTSNSGIATFRVDVAGLMNAPWYQHRYGATIFAKTADTFLFLSANPNTGKASMSGGSSTNVNWTKDLAFTVNESTITATAFYESSLRKFKTNIKPFKTSALKLIDSLDIVTFDRIDDETKNKIGVIADDTSEEFLSEDKDAVDLYKTIFIQAKAIQELEKKNQSLEKRLERLERMLENL